MRIQPKPVVPLLIAGLFSGWGPPALMANGMRLVSQDAFAAARGEAFAATADNPSAIYYNPAGLTQLEGLNLRGGLNGLYFDPTFVPPSGRANGGTTYHIENKLAAAPQFYAAYAWDTVPVTAGIGLYSPYGASVTWPEDTGFRAVAIEGSLTYLRANPVVAVEIAPGVSLGGGVFIDYGRITSEQGLARTAAPFPNSFRFEGDGWGVGYNLGLLWRIQEKLSFGATFRSQTTIDFQGQTDIEQQPRIQPTETPASVEYVFPLTAVFGLSYRPTPRWNLEANMDYTDWSSIGVLTIRHEATPPQTIQRNIPVTLLWKASWIYEFGVTHYFEDGWHLSAGYAFNQNSVPDDYYTPVVADLDRHFLALGMGRETKRFSFDLTYQFGYGPERTVVNSISPSSPGNFVGQNADGTYEWISHSILLSAGFRF